MYTKHFDLTEEPFSIAANPRFLYMSARHREALALLLYGIRSDSGFVMLTGEVGTGKTTVCRSLMGQLPAQSNVAFILNPKVTVNELLSSICDEFGIDYAQTGSSVKTYVDAINHYLLEQHAVGRNTVVIIDEAQNLSFDVLEQLRLLTNLETNERKLLRIILLDQPELETMLSRPEFKQVEQRITARYTLHRLDRHEVQAYVSHRLAVAGCREPVFSSRVINKLYAKTQGVPRLINIVCDRAMLGAYVNSQHRVSLKILNKAVKEVQGRSHQQQWFTAGSFVLTSLLIVVVAMAALIYTNKGEVSMLQVKLSDAPSTDKISAMAVTESQSIPAVVMIDEIKRESESVNSEWPDTMSSAADDTNALAHAMLFRQWNKVIEKSIVDPCALALTWGLRCYSGTGNIGTLVNNDRPVILTLLDKEGRQYQATLLSLENELASVAFAHGIETVALRDLEARWHGQYKLLWQMTPQGLSIIKPGEHGSMVRWLTQSLIDTGNRSLPVKELYDADVTEAVKEFQRGRGLLVDGVTGRQTLIHLNSVNDKTIPRLSSQGEG